MKQAAKDGRETLQERFDLEKARAVLARTRAAGGSYSPDAVAKLLNALDTAQAEIARLKREQAAAQLEITRLSQAAPLPVAVERDLEMKMCRWVGLNGAKPSPADLAEYISHELDNREDMDVVFAAVLREAASLLRQPEAVTVRSEPRSTGGSSDGR